MWEVHLEREKWRENRLAITIITTIIITVITVITVIVINIIMIES